MTFKIFITGATGYIGGDFLFAIEKVHPDAQITCLVRNSDKGAKIAVKYPSIRLVYGDLDSSDLITEESKAADIIYNFANCDHVGAAQAISRGLAHAGKPVFWIHTSGTMILAWESIEQECWGELLPKVYNDWEGISELVSFPDQAAHREVDKIVLATSAHNPNVKTAIVCPPTIYGPGRGPDNQRSQQAYAAAKFILKRRQGFLPGRGENIWHSVHVQDLSDLYLKLGEAAMAENGAATWNEQGYYLAENGSFAWKEIFTQLTKIAKEKGFIENENMPELAQAALVQIMPGGHRMWGTTSRGEALRGRKLLGWTPKERPLFEELPDIVDNEARALGIIQGHAAKVEQ